MSQILTNLKIKMIDESESYEYFFEVEPNMSSETNMSLNADAKRSNRRRKLEQIKITFILFYFDF